VTAARRLRRVAVAGTLLASAVGIMPVGVAGAGAEPAPVFAHPVTVDAQRMVGEPDVTVGADGRIYASAPWGVSTDTSFFWRSEDGGESFRQVQAAPGDQNPYAFRAGGDTEIQAFPPASGRTYPGEATPGPGSPARLYFMDQNNLDSNTCGYSTDAARTFTYTNGAVCPQSVGADRQWIAQTRVDPSSAANGGVLDHDISYLWYDHFENGGLQLYRSDDGQSYAFASKPTGVSGNAGNVVTDRASGVVYMIAPGQGSSVAVAYSADGGKSTHTVGLPHGGSSGGVGTDFPVVAIDTAGNLYVVWSEQNGTGAWRTWVTHSTGFTTVDNGTRTVSVAGATAAQWSTPVPITGPGSANPAINYSVFPWIVAGDPGRVDVVYYGTTQALGYDPNSQAAKWGTYMWQTLDFGSVAAGPTDASVQATAPVAEASTHLASICFSGIGCTGTGNRNMLDFFEVHLNTQGGAVVVYNDDANSLAALFPGGPQVMIGQQAGGPSLFATVGSLSGAPTPDASFVADRAGDGYYPTSDTSVDSLDLLGAGAALKNASTLQVTFAVKNLANAVTQVPPTEGATGITYVLTWKHADDLWYAAAHLDPAGSATFDAGLPQSVPFTGTGGPKFAVYGPNPNSTVLSGGSVDTTHGTITIDVPLADVGGLKPGDRLLQATGFSLVDRGHPGAGILADQSDATPSFDDSLVAPGVGVPEAPWVVLLPLVAAVTALTLRARRRTT